MDTKITEVQVAVKTLTVNGKKMSWSFFKQIPVKELEEGQVLGYVPYRNTLPGSSVVQWVVFVHEGTLYKSLLNSKSSGTPQLYIGA